MDPSTALSGVPPGLRGDLLDAFTEIVRNFRENRWEPSELNGGKLCEAAYTIAKGYVDGKMPDRAKKPRNMVDACRDLQGGGELERSMRFQIPRMLVALYEIRNNRGVGHVGGDVNPNHMDARIVLESAKWVMAELVRVFHKLSPKEATDVVDALVERTVPIVWELADRKRVLQSDLSRRDQTLLLLYSTAGPVTESDLIAWVEISNKSNYRRDILEPAHQERLIEFDRTSGLVHLSPKGTAYVEEKLPLDLLDANRN
ncbi:MAG TPA: hypothetical protein VFB49_10150 [Patescibacteria group bacterium]|nr:hypothetical protein [Patescibacteria group bacterium]